MARNQTSTTQTVVKESPPANSSSITPYRDENYTVWALNGVPHKDDGPAVIESNGTEMWYRDGHLHRIGGPAAYGTTQTGEPFQEWFFHGKFHRTDGPAIVRGGEKFWYFNGRETSNVALCEQATDPSTGSDTLIALCGDEDYVVRNLALNNPNCPEEGEVLHALKYENK